MSCLQPQIFVNNLRNGLSLFSQHRIFLAEFLPDLEVYGMCFNHNLEGDGPLVSVPCDRDTGLGGRHRLPWYHPNSRLC